MARLLFLSIGLLLCWGPFYKSVHAMWELFTATAKLTVNIKSPMGITSCKVAEVNHTYIKFRQIFT